MPGLVAEPEQPPRILAPDRQYVERFCDLLGEMTRSTDTRLSTDYSAHVR